MTDCVSLSFLDFKRNAIIWTFCLWPKQHWWGLAPGGRCCLLLNLVLLIFFGRELSQDLIWWCKKKKKKKRRSNTNHFYRKMHKHSQAGSPVMLNWVAFSSCNRWSSSLRPPPSSDEEEKAGAGSTARGERGLHTVLHDSNQQQEDVRHPWVTTFLKLFFSFHRWSEDTLTIQQAGDNSHSLMTISEPNTDNWS